MTNVQHIIWSNVKNTLTLDTMLWKLPQRLLDSLDLKDVNCTIKHSLNINWGAQKGIEKEDIIEWMKCENSFQFDSKIPKFALEIRSKQVNTQELPTLILNCLQLGAQVIPESIYQSKILEIDFVATDAESQWEKIVEALKKRPNLNSLWDPVHEEIRILKGATYEFWPLNEISAQDWPAYEEFLKSEFAEGETHPLKNPHFLIEKANAEDEEQPKFFQNQLGKELWSNLYGKEFKPHADFLFYKPKRWKLKNIPEYSPLRMMAQAYALSGKAQGFFVELDNNLAFPRTEIISSLPVSSERFYFQKPGDHLFFIGPWESQNKVLEQFFTKWLEGHPDLLIRGVILDSSDNWVFNILNTIFKSSGWRFEKSAFEKFVKVSTQKGPSTNLFVFWGETKDLSKISSNNFPVALSTGILGSRDREGVFTVEGFPESEVFLKKLRDQHLEQRKASDVSTSLKTVILEKPQTKSASYGYDKATAFPDQYSINAHTLTRGNVPEWIEALWLNRTGSKIWNSSMGSFLNVPITAKKVISADALNIVAGQRLRSLWTHNPTNAALILIDDALRAILCQGASMKRLGANLWIGYGKRLSSQTQAALTLFFDSFKEGLAKIGVTLDSLKLSPIPQNEGLDAFLILRSQEGILDPPDAFSGFRMDEECIYSVGPRPFQMESGSTVLKFVRVYSNYTSHIELEKQLHLYMHLADLLKKGSVSSIIPVFDRGVAGAILNMSLWSMRGAQFRPALSAIELFSSSPGRVLVGVLPQDAKSFESEFRGEQIISVATVKGDRLWGLKLHEMLKVISEYEKDHIA